MIDFCPYCGRSLRKFNGQAVPYRDHKKYALVMRLHKSGLSLRKVAKAANVSKSTVERYIEGNGKWLYFVKGRRNRCR